MWGCERDQLISQGERSTLPAPRSGACTIARLLSLQRSKTKPVVAEEASARSGTGGNAVRRGGNRPNDSAHHLSKTPFPPRDSPLPAAAPATKAAAAGPAATAECDSVRRQGLQHREGRHGGGGAASQGVVIGLH
jgi:hypothetical protein